MSPIGKYLKGNIGMSIMPGSTRVWDRVNNVMVDCTASLCHGSDAIVRQDRVTGDNVTRYVNRVSYSGQPGYGASINAFSNRGYQEASYQVVSYMGRNILNRDSFYTAFIVPYGPIMTKQLTLEPEAFAYWPKAYNRSDVHAYLSATIDIMAHPNTLIDLKMASQPLIRMAMDDAARLVERDGTGAIPAIMAQTSGRLSDIANQYEPGGFDTFREVYWKGIHFSPAREPEASPVHGQSDPPPPPSGQTSSRAGQGVAVGVSVPVGVSVIAVAVVAVLLRRRAKHRTLLGKVVPPGLGPLTTLLVTDIQSSTSLWDTLPQDVMESSVALHYAVLRHVAHVNGGHESATEGDSIILGFHDPLSATRAAVQAQAELLAADWPKGLLNHPLCALKYAVPVTGVGEQAIGQPAQLTDGVNHHGTLPPFPLWDTDAVLATQHLATSPDPVVLDNGPKTRWSRCRQAWQAFAYSRAPRANSTVPVTGPVSWPLGTGAQEPGSSTVGDFLSTLVTLSDQPPSTKAGSTMLYRGLRVRIGVHTGLTDVSSVTTNVLTGRLQYAGKALAIATAVSCAGHGGMVLLSEDTFGQLDSASLATKGLLLASMGSVQLMDVDAPVELYQALTQQLAYRVCFNAHLRYSQQLSPSFLDAPHDRMIVCFINAVGLAALNAWSSTITQSSIQVYKCVAAAQLERHDGYLANSSAGMFVAVFKDPARAIRWALCTLQQCFEVDWDPALLEHELGEEVVVGQNLTEVTDDPTDDDMPSINELRSGLAQDEPKQHSSLPRMSCDARGSFLTRQCDVTLNSHHSTSQLASFTRHSRRQVKTVTRKTVLFRGLRLKCAVDVGQAKASIEPSTGRVMYFGRAMNRCARVSAMTRTGQVWCTQDVWDLASPTINTCEAQAAAWHDRGSAKPVPDGSGPAPPCQSTPLSLSDLILCPSQQLRRITSASPGASVAGRSTTASKPRRMQSVPMLDEFCERAPRTSPGRKHSFSRAKTTTCSFKATVDISPFSFDGGRNDKRPSDACAGLAVSRIGRAETAPCSDGLKARSCLHRPYIGLQSEHRGDPKYACTHEEALPRSLRYSSGFVLCGDVAPEARPQKLGIQMAPMLVAGVPLGRCKLRGIQESVGLVHVRFDDERVVQIAKQAGGGGQEATPRNRV